MLLQIIWLLCGVFAAGVQMYSYRKDWWEEFQEDYFKNVICIPNFLISILMVFGGPFSIVAALITNKLINVKSVIYFKIPKN